MLGWMWQPRNRSNDQIEVTIYRSRSEVNRVCSSDVEQHLQHCSTQQLGGV